MLFREALWERIRSMSITDLKHINENGIDYHLITNKYREFFFPVLMIAMAKYLTTFVDSVLISTFLGVDRMPAVNLCFPVVCFISLFHGMVGIGGSLIAANAYAEHDRNKGNRVFSAAMTFIVMLGVFTAFLGMVLRSYIVPLLCSDPSLQKDTGTYFSVMILGFPFFCLLICLSRFIQMDGFPKLTSNAMLISNAVNLCMDCVLMTLCKMGLEGAAAATVIGYICGIIFLLAGYIRSSKRQLRFVWPFASGLRTFFSDIRDICINGFSTASVWLYLMICIDVMNSLILTYCEPIDLQAFAICRNNVNLCYVFFLGIAQTLSPIAAVYAHRGDYDRVRYILKRSILYILASSVIMGLFFVLFSHPILWLYGVNDPHAVVYLSRCLRIYTLTFPGIAFILLMNYYFQAIKAQKLSTGLTILEGLIFPVCLAFFLTPHFKMNGVWTALIVSEAVPVLLVLIYLRIDRCKSRSFGERIFRLPKIDDRRICGFSVRMDVSEIVEKTRDISMYIEEKTDHHTAVITCLALEEMLTGIALANNNRENVIDVMLREKDKDIEISIRDMGVGFNPLVRDEALAYDFDNAMVLQSIASDIQYDLSLGMNDTTIRLAGNSERQCHA